MKRTTVMLPDDLEARLRLEARRRGVPIAVVVREAVAHHLPRPSSRRSLSFVTLGEAGSPDASELVEDHVRQAIRRRREC